MRNILIISFFHSSPRHVGAIRTQRFARYLPQFGWSPFVITKPSLHYDSEEDIARCENISYAPSIPLNNPFRLEVFTWIPFMLAKALKILRRHRIDVVLISCPPFHPALVGILLKKMLGIRLVIDYRDAWSLNPYYVHMDWFHRLILQVDNILEGRLLYRTDLLIVSHQSMKHNYLRKFSFLEGKIEVVYNGFDPETIRSGENTLFPEFTILHLGDFYANQKTRDPGVFLTALQDMISEEKISTERFRVLFIGERYAEIEEAISNKSLSAYVSCLDRVPHPIAMEYLNKSHMLLLIETRDVMTTKVFEYLATGKPLLCLIKKGGELETFIRRFSANSYVIPSNSVNYIKEAVHKCFSNHERGIYRSITNDDFKGNFTRMEQTRHLAELLERMIENQHTGQGI